MLFNSYAFVFAFLPVTLAVFYAVRNVPAGQTAWLVLASLFFYGYWKAGGLPILIGSILFNYAMGRWILAWQANRSAQKLILAGAIAGDLALLGYYKYAGFFAENLSAAFGIPCATLAIILPIGISFFTFTQIAYLVDAYSGRVNDTDFLRYVLFVAYFPHLVAGPILHHAEMMPQFRAMAHEPFAAERMSVGMTVFAIGLFKKVCLADSVAVYVPPVFDAPVPNFSTADAWVGALAYTFQLYFDFSGYSDMALGMSFMLGIKIPLNFASPYKANSIIDFWKRWHMSLSAFLRDYLYIPLGGNRRGPAKRYVNLMITMLLGGLWHGAAWTFVIWGALNGLFLLVNHAWRATGIRMPSLLAWMLTFLCVVVAWVFFRAPNLDSALAILAAMAGAPTGTGLALASMDSIVMLTVLASLALLSPNTQELMGRHVYYLGPAAPASWLSWRPSPSWAAATAVILVAGVVFVSRQSTFLYYQF